MKYVLPLLFGLGLNILWFFIPLGEETGFASLWGASPFLAILISLVPNGFFAGWIIQAIKKW